MTAPAEPVTDINEVTLRGRVHSHVHRKAGWGEGDRFEFDLAVRRPPRRGRPHEIDVVPVVVPATESLSDVVDDLVVGDPIDVRGTIRRRITRTPTGSTHAIEVYASIVARTPTAADAAATTPEQRSNA